MNLSFILIIAAAMFVSWMIGANSVSTTFGPVASSRAGGVLRGAFYGGIFGLIGAIVQGSNVAGTIGSGLLKGASISIVTGSIVLLTASVLIIIGVFSETPIPVAFTVVGGVLGAGLGQGIGWNIGQVQVIIVTWIAISFIAIFLGYIFSKTLTAVLEKEGSEDILSVIVFLIGSFCAYTAGANLIGLAVGPLMVTVNVNPQLLLLFGGAVILTGSWIGGPRIVNAVSKEYSELGLRRSICALATASVLAQVATFFGVPVSFNQAIITSMIGSGLVAGTGSIGLEKIGMTALSWVASFFASMGIVGGIMFLLL